MYFDDEDDRLKYRKLMRADFNGGWDSSKITVQHDGAWMIFVDPDKKEKLNQAKSIPKVKKQLYHHKQYQISLRKVEDNPFDHQNNYSSYRPHRTLHQAPPIDSAHTSTNSHPNLFIPTTSRNMSIKYFQGDRPLRTRFRQSLKITQQPKELIVHQPLETCSSSRRRNYRRYKFLYENNDNEITENNTQKIMENNNEEKSENAESKEIFDDHDKEITENNDKEITENNDKENTENNDKENTENNVKEIIENNDKEITENNDKEVTENNDKENTENNDKENSENNDKENSENNNRSI